MKKILATTIAILFVLSTATVFGQGRDSDGTRMQARSIRIGANANDRISSPHDRVDWYYFRVRKGQTVHIVVSSKGAPAVTLVNAMGKTLSSGSRISKTLATGIYYISIGGNGSFHYSLSVR